MATGSEEKDTTEPASAQGKPTEQPATPGKPRQGGGLHNTLPLVFSGIAVLIAALALVANQMSKPAPGIDPVQLVNSKLGQIEARIGDMELQLNNDKLSGVQMQLKRIMLELEQLSRLADKPTRNKIDEAYNLLKQLSGPATNVKAEVDMQSTLEGKGQSADTAAEPVPAEPLASPESEITNEPAAPDAGQMEEVTQPIEAAPMPSGAPLPEQAEPGSVVPEPDQPESVMPQEPVTHL